MADFDDDTLYLHSDTIVANLDSLQKQQIKAFTGVKFYSQNLQGKCQSTLLLYEDSTIHMFDSHLWSDRLSIDFRGCYFRN